jgi:hypothetical protein
MANRNHMIKGLSQVISNHLERKQPCLHAIIAFLLGEHVRASIVPPSERDDVPILINQPRGEYARAIQTQDRSRVPYPCLCGASFTADGKYMILLPHSECSFCLRSCCRFLH